MGNISTKVENASIEAAIELKMASVDVENASIEVEMKAGVGDGVKILTERVSSYDDMSLLFEDACKTELESMVLSDTSIADVGNKILEKYDGSTELSWKLSSSSMLEVPCECKSVAITMFEEGSDGTADIVGFREKPFVWKSGLEDGRNLELMKKDTNVARNCCFVKALGDIRVE